jgi:peroxiredoxin
MKLKILATLLLTFSVINGFAQKIPTGIWRGVLKTQAGKQIPFNFDVKTIAGKQQVTLINADERLRADGIIYGKDSIFIKLPFDSEFRLKLQDGRLQGKWLRHLGDHDLAMDISATRENYRFAKKVAKPVGNISGRWSAVFINAQNEQDNTVGEFKQVGAKLTGTFLTTTGDYRYLEGVVSGDNLYLSGFNGNGNYLITGKIKGNTITDGKLYAGLTSVSTWTATKNDNAKLPDAYSLTALKPGYKKIAFTFKDMSGNKVSLTDSRFKNKVVIVQILGSWCPNCMDETEYMIKYYKKFHPKGIEVVGLAYERTADFAKSKAALLPFKNRFNVPYSILITGYIPADAAKSLPMLVDVIGFPTTIIIDKKGDVRKIHTGFNGPSTGAHYTEFIDEFETLTNNLLAEK